MFTSPPIETDFSSAGKAAYSSAMASWLAGIIGTPGPVITGTTLQSLQTNELSIIAANDPTNLAGATQLINNSNNLAAVQATADAANAKVQAVPTIAQNKATLDAISASLGMNTLAGNLALNQSIIANALADGSVKPIAVSSPVLQQSIPGSVLITNPTTSVPLSANLTGSNVVTPANIQAIVAPAIAQILSSSPVMDSASQISPNLVSNSNPISFTSSIPVTSSIPILSSSNQSTQSTIKSSDNGLFILLGGGILIYLLFGKKLR